jgi:signal transduction histidine kinase
VGLLAGLNLASPWNAARSPLGPLLSTLIIVFLFTPLRDRVQAVVDRLFYRTRADYRDTVTQISAALTSVIALDVIVDRVLRTLTGEMFVATAALLLRVDEDGTYRVYRAEGEHGVALGAAHLPPDSALVQLLRTSAPAVLGRDDVIEAPRHAARRADYLRDLDTLAAALVIPLSFTGELIGLLALGEKLSGRAYGAEDVTLLRTLADESAVAINNAMAFKKLEDLRASLEERVRARTEELAALNVALEASNARLRELDQLKSDFVSDVSHELRTPLTSIKGYVDYLLEGSAGELSPVQKDFLARVRSNGERLSRLSNDLLDLARIEAGRVEFRPARLVLRDVARDVLDVLQPLASEKTVELALAVPAAVAVRADRDKLHQILLNLSHNAVKFTPPGGQVRVGARASADGTVVTVVEDTGEGIPADELSRVFEKFHQVGQAPASRQGSGLGLTITRKLVELHGGAIWAESEPGRGSAFCFTLPAAGAEAR